MDNNDTKSVVMDLAKTRFCTARSEYELSMRYDEIRNKYKNELKDSELGADIKDLYEYYRNKMEEEFIYDLRLFGVL